MEKTIKKLSMVLIMVCLVISFSTPFMMFPSKVYGGATAIDIAAIPGVTAPVTGATPVATITETAQYTGTITWSDSPVTFAASTVYTATITILPKSGYYLTEVGANFFTVSGATPVTNTAGSGVVTAVFPATAAASSASAPASRSLTPEEIVALNLTIQQQVDRYGATNNGFVRMLYDNALGRVYDGGGFGFWTGELTANTMAGSQIAYHFIFSAELAPTINSLSDNDFIAFLYQTLMNRSYDSEGYANWQKHLESGMTREEMVNYYVNSPEFAGICASFNVTP
jgi:hypothetical protein